ncbi:MAG: Zn-dependent exopeptidase M28 [Candidatus Lokiarchaeota archaeon]|nr:Zn-dependent exopeptidase M28 [Candidatus Lokiarchaeota archaeon]
MTSEDASTAALLALTAKLSFPRRTGTPGNSRARDIIAGELRASGYEVVEEPFWYLPRRVQVPSLALATCSIWTTFGIFAVTWFSAMNQSWLLPFLGACLLFALFVQHSMPVRWRMRSTGDVSSPLPRGARWGTNIVARIGGSSPRDDSASFQLVLAAHHDSLSLAYPPALNIFIILCNTVGVLLCGTLAIVIGLVHALSGSVNPWSRLFVALSSLVACCTLVAKLLNTRSNNSPGAVDNATGCAVLLELARALKRNPDPLRFPETRLVFFDAEEAGLWGSCFHAARLDHWLRGGTKRHACFISIDEAGGKGPLVASGAFGFPVVTRPPHDPALDGFVESLLRAGARRGTTTWMPYPASDHAPFAAIGVPSTWISHACTVAHSPRDTMGEVSAAHMAAIFKALLGFVKAEKKEETWG